MDDKLWLRFVRILNIVTVDMNNAVRIISEITIDPSKKDEGKDIRQYVHDVYAAAIQEQMFGL